MSVPVGSVVKVVSAPAHFSHLIGKEVKADALFGKIDPECQLFLVGGTAAGLFMNGSSSIKTSQN